MDLSDEVKNVIKLKQLQTTAPQKLTFREYNEIITNRLKNVNSELFMLFHELAQHIDQEKSDEINKILLDFRSNEINELHEKIKDCYY